MRRYSWLILLLVCLIRNSAHAAVVITVSEVGNDVIMSGSGTANLVDLEFKFRTSVGSHLDTGSPNIPVSVLTGSVFGFVDIYHLPNLNGPSYLQDTRVAVVPDGNLPLLGHVFGISYTQLSPSLLVPAEYVSGSQLTAHNTFSGRTLASMGLESGTYVWTWGSDSSADSFTIIIGASAAPVPEPESVIVFLMGGLILGLYLRISKLRSSDNFRRTNEGLGVAS